MGKTQEYVVTSEMGTVRRSRTQVLDLRKAVSWQLREEPRPLEGRTGGVTEARAQRQTTDEGLSSRACQAVSSGCGRQSRKATCRGSSREVPRINESPNVQRSEDAKQAGGKPTRAQHAPSAGDHTQRSRGLEVTRGRRHRPRCCPRRTPGAAGTDGFTNWSQQVSRGNKRIRKNAHSPQEKTNEEEVENREQPAGW